MPLLTQKRIGPVTDFKTAQIAIRDLESLIQNVINVLETPEDVPAAGEIRFFVREEDGSYHLYSLVAGAGITLTPDTALKTLTITSP